jgi:hypothetical protein
VKSTESKAGFVASNQKVKQPFFSKGRNNLFARGSVFESSSFFKPQASANGFFNNGFIQPKLTVGQPNDHYEQEADAMADKVAQRLSEKDTVPENKNGKLVQTRPVAPVASITPLVQTKCAACEQDEKLQKKEEEEKEPLETKLQKKPIFESNALHEDEPVQRKCSECEKKDKLQKKENNSSEETISPSMESSINAAKGSGNPLPADTRQNMESSLSADFSKVRIHNDSSSVQMNKDINAQAFTHGSDIYFNTGKYDTISLSGKHLLAHELTHTMQQNNSNPIRKKNVVRSDALETKDAFIQRVFTKAKQRLNNNMENLDKWSKYIDEQFNELALQAQVRGQEAIDLFRDATMRGKSSHFEAWCSMRRPNQRAVEESVMKGLIQGGCQYCHSSNQAWERDNNLLRSRGFSGFDALPSPREMLLFDAAYSEAYRLSNSHGQTIPSVEFKTHTAGEVATNTHTLVEWLKQQEAVEINKITGNHISTTGSSSANIPQIASSDVPYTRSGLCDDVPEGESTPAPPVIDPSMVGPCTMEAFAAISRIRPVLEPLGTSGYRVLPRDVFSRLYDSPPQVIRSIVNANILRRQQEYQALINRINAGKVPYIELCRIVDELLPTTNTEVRNAVIADKIETELRRSILDILIIALSLISILLMFIFPPAGLLLGAFVGGAMMGRGAVNIQRGLTYKQGLGAGVFTQSQEASADTLIVSGFFDFVMGALTAGTSIAGLAKPVPVSRAITSTPSTAGKGGWTRLQTPAGEMWTNSRFPDIAMWRNGTNWEITNVAGDVIAHGGMTPNGYWVVLGRQPAGSLPSPGSTAGPGVAAEATGIVPRGVPVVPGKSGAPPKTLPVSRPEIPLLPAPKPTATDFYSNPALLWGKPHTEIGNILKAEGWTAGTYQGTSNAYTFIKNTPGGKLEIVINYGGGRHFRGQVGTTPSYYKISGGGMRRTKVIDANTYPAADMAAENSRFIDGPTGRIVKQ